MLRITKVLFIIFISMFILFADFSFPEIPGWKRNDSVRVYNSDNLWNYINGAADAYLDYGFVNLKTCNLMSNNNKITIDIYNMGNKLNAFGIYESERADTYSAINIGTQSVYYPPFELNMLKDRYYVIIRSYGDSLNLVKGKKILKIISNSLTGDTSFPQNFEYLPKNNKIPDSERYIKKDFLGMAQLQNIILANYKVGKQEYKVFYFVNSSENLENKWLQFSENWEKINSTKFFIKMYEIPYQGKVLLLKSKQGIFGVSGLDDEESFLELFKSITETQ